MTATREDISTWFDAGEVGGYTHMIIVCDTYDYENYPRYVKSHEDPRSVAALYTPRNMERVDEVYDLRKDRDEQLDEVRAFNY